MKQILYLALLALLCACNSNAPKETKSPTQLRAESDTSLVFQGLALGQPLDTTKYNSLKASIPFKLYDAHNKEYAFDFLYVDTVSSGRGNNNLHGICVANMEADRFYLISLVAFYEESYGLFSYYQTQGKNDAESFSAGMRMGDPNPQKQGSVYERKDAIDAYLTTRMSRYEKDYIYRFVWEWKNQRIILEANPSSVRFPINIYYQDKGYDERIKCKNEMEAQRKHEEDARNTEIEAAKVKQQI